MGQDWAWDWRQGGLCMCFTPPLYPPPPSQEKAWLVVWDIVALHALLPSLWACQLHVHLWKTACTHSTCVCTNKCGVSRAKSFCPHCEPPLDLSFVVVSWFGFDWWILIFDFGDRQGRHSRQGFWFWPGSCSTSPAPVALLTGLVLNLLETSPSWCDWSDLHTHTHAHTFTEFCCLWIWGFCHRLPRYIYCCCCWFVFCLVVTQLPFATHTHGALYTFALRLFYDFDLLRLVPCIVCYYHPPCSVARCLSSSVVGVVTLGQIVMENPFPHPLCLVQEEDHLPSYLLAGRTVIADPLCPLPLFVTLPADPIDGPPTPRLPDPAFPRLTFTPPHCYTPAPTPPPACRYYRPERCYRYLYICVPAFAAPPHKAIPFYVATLCSSSFWMMDTDSVCSFCTFAFAFLFLFLFCFYFCFCLGLLGSSSQWVHLDRHSPLSLVGEQADWIWDMVFKPLYIVLIWLVCCLFCLFIFAFLVLILAFCFVLPFWFARYFTIFAVWFCCTRVFAFVPGTPPPLLRAHTLHCSLNSLISLSAFLSLFLTSSYLPPALHSTWRAAQKLLRKV